MFSNELFGQRIKEIRRQVSGNQTELGRIIGTGKSHVSEIEKGLACTTAEGLAVRCEHYQVSSDYLLGLSDDPTPRKDQGRA